MNIVWLIAFAYISSCWAEQLRYQCQQHDQSLYTVTISIACKDPYVIYRDYLAVTSDHPDLTITGWKSETPTTARFDKYFKKNRTAFTAAVKLTVHVTVMKPSIEGAHIQLTYMTSKQPTLQRATCAFHCKTPENESPLTQSYIPYAVPAQATFTHPPPHHIPMQQPDLFVHVKNIVTSPSIIFILATLCVYLLSMTSCTIQLRTTLSTILHNKHPLTCGIYFLLFTLFYMFIGYLLSLIQIMPTHKIFIIATASYLVFYAGALYAHYALQVPTCIFQIPSIYMVRSTYIHTALLAAYSLCLFLPVCRALQYVAPYYPTTNQIGLFAFLGLVIALNLIHSTQSNITHDMFVGLCLLIFALITLKPLVTLLQLYASLTSVLAGSGFVYLYQADKKSTTSMTHSLLGTICIVLSVICGAYTYQVAHPIAPTDNPAHMALTP